MGCAKCGGNRKSSAKCCLCHAPKASKLLFPWGRRRICNLCKEKMELKLDQMQAETTRITKKLKGIEP